MTTGPPGTLPWPRDGEREDASTAVVDGDAERAQGGEHGAHRPGRARAGRRRR